MTGPEWEACDQLSDYIAVSLNQNAPGLDQSRQAIRIAECCQGIKPTKITTKQTE